MIPYHMGPFHMRPFHMGLFHMGPYHMGPCHMEPYHMGPYHMETFHMGPYGTDPLKRSILYGPHWTIWYQPFVTESVYHLYLWIQTLNFSF